MNVASFKNIWHQIESMLYITKGSLLHSSPRNFMNTKLKIQSVLAGYFPSSVNPRTIGDDMFYIIETTPKLLKEYRKGSKSQNALIAKVIKEHYILRNLVNPLGTNIRNKSPRSTLICSFQEFV